MLSGHSAKKHLMQNHFSRRAFRSAHRCQPAAKMARLGSTGERPTATDSRSPFAAAGSQRQYVRFWRAMPIKAACNCFYSEDPEECEEKHSFSGGVDSSHGRNFCPRQRTPPSVGVTSFAGTRAKLRRKSPLAALIAWASFGIAFSSSCARNSSRRSGDIPTDFPTETPTDHETPIDRDTPNDSLVGSFTKALHVEWQ